MSGSEGRGGSRDEETADERESRSVGEGEESDVRVDCFFPGCAEHLDGCDRTEFAELRREDGGSEHTTR